MKISLFGLFGAFNKGNNVTLRAMLSNSQRILPEAEISCICWDHVNVEKDFNIPAIPLNRPPRRKSWHRERLSRLGVLSKFLNRALVEPVLWLRAYKHLRGNDIILMTGTGMLSDAGLGPFRMPYDLFKWSLTAKLCRVKIYFISVGAGPIFHPVSKWFIRFALSLAEYRSFRDDYSRQYIHDLNLNTDRDFIYPDLAFSLPKSYLPKAREDFNSDRLIVGVGLMAYYGQRYDPYEGEFIYKAYISKISAFIAWLLGQGHIVRITIGDSPDVAVIDDVLENLNQRKIKYQDQQFISEPIHSFEDLLSQLARTDIVVASRFHNLILALMLNKPVVSVSYHGKSSELLTTIGLNKYFQPIEELDVEKLIEQFSEVANNREYIVSRIREYMNHFRNLLDDQYVRIFL